MRFCSCLKGNLNAIVALSDLVLMNFEMQLNKKKNYCSYSIPHILHVAKLQQIHSVQKPVFRLHFIMGGGHFRSHEFNN